MCVCVCVCEGEYCKTFISFLYNQPITVFNRLSYLATGPSPASSLRAALRLALKLLSRCSLFRTFQNTGPDLGTAMIWRESTSRETHLWSADFVEADEDGGVDEAAEGQIGAEGERGQRQQQQLRQKADERQNATPAVLRRHVQQVEVRREVVPDVSARQVIQIRLLEESPAVPSTDSLHCSFWTIIRTLFSRCQNNSAVMRGSRS